MATIVERDLSDAELALVNAGFDQHAVEHGNPKEASKRFGFVAVDDGRFVGCSSGLAYRKAIGYGNWFYITDLFVEKSFRGQGTGTKLLQNLEQRVVDLDIGNVWTWTAGYEAPDFYKNMGYEVFCEMDDWYSNGHSRIGLRKALLS